MLSGNSRKKNPLFRTFIVLSLCFSLVFAPTEARAEGLVDFAKALVESVTHLVENPDDPASYAIPAGMVLALLAPIFGKGWWSLYGTATEKRDEEIEKAQKPINDALEKAKKELADLDDDYTTEHAATRKRLEGQIRQHEAALKLPCEIEFSRANYFFKRAKLLRKISVLATLLSVFVATSIGSKVKNDKWPWQIQAERKETNRLKAMANDMERARALMEAENREKEKARAPGETRVNPPLETAKNERPVVEKAPEKNSDRTVSPAESMAQRQKPPVKETPAYGRLHSAPKTETETRKAPEIPYARPAASENGSPRTPEKSEPVSPQPSEAPAVASRPNVTEPERVMAPPAEVVPAKPPKPSIAQQMKVAAEMGDKNFTRLNLAFRQSIKYNGENVMLSLAQSKFHESDGIAQKRQKRAEAKSAVNGVFKDDIIETKFFVVGSKLFPDHRIEELAAVYGKFDGDPHERDLLLNALFKKTFEEFFPDSSWLDEALLKALRKKFIEEWQNGR